MGSLDVHGSFLDDLDMATTQARGAQLFASVMADEAPPPDTTLTAVGVMAFEFGAIWARPGLSRRDRRILTLTCASAAAAESTVEAHVGAALRTGDLTVEEMQEAILHVAVYLGWPHAECLDRAMRSQARRIATEDGTDPEIPAPWQRPPWGSVDERDRHDAETFEAVMTFAAPPPVSPYVGAGVLRLVFGELWDRPGLTRRDRRMITLASVNASDADGPIESHVFAALNSGDITPDEAREIVLHLAVYSGWPKASRLEGVIMQQWAHIQESGGPVTTTNS